MKFPLIIIVLAFIANAVIWAVVLAGGVWLVVWMLRALNVIL